MTSGRGERVDARHTTEGPDRVVSDNQNLLAEQRRALILDEVRKRGGIRVNELTRKLNVSDMTVRRDLDALARQGVIEKVHGGPFPWSRRARTSRGSRRSRPLS